MISTCKVLVSDVLSFNLSTVKFVLVLFGVKKLLVGC